MRQFLSRRMIRLTLPILTIMVVTLACAIPGLSGNKAQPSATAGTPEGTPATPTVESGAPNSLLTQAAATLYAPLSATWTAQAGGQPAAPAGAQPPAQQPPAAQPPVAQPPAQPQPTAQPGLIQPVQPPAAQPAQPAQQPAAQPGSASLLAPLPTPTHFWAQLLNQPAGGAAQPASGGQPAQPAGNQTPLIQPVQPGQQQPGQQPQPSQNFLTFPLAGFFVQEGAAARLQGVNLPVCGGIYAANFLVQNTGSVTFESLSYQVANLGDNTLLAGPATNNAPFMNTDTTCTPGGVSALAPGSALFVGGSLGAANLSGQTVRVELRLCTQDNLAGQCEPLAVEFVVP